uniref:FBD domain-containing protein n=1 Tax=Oryza punctata TaxID=4537 RepID=A0A0E0MHK7_ORYPU
MRKFLMAGGEMDDVVDAVVSHPAVRHVEDLRVAAVADDDRSSKEAAVWNNAVYVLTLVSLPSETLRVLDITGCKKLVLPARAAAAVAVAFPWLETLQLRYCDVRLKHLQRLIDAAPVLTTVHLESVYFNYVTNRFINGEEESEEEEFAGGDNGDTVEPRLLLRFPAATAIVLALCGSSSYNGSGAGGIGIDAPKLRSFKYIGLPRRFYLKSPAPEMTAVNLHFLDVVNDHQLKDDTTHANFWQFIGNFTNTKILKLKLHGDLDHLAITGKARRAELLRVFPNLDRLELDAVARPTIKKSSAAIAQLLRCCPALRDLSLKLNTTSSADSFCCHGGSQQDFDKSVDQFKRRKLNPTSTEVSLINGDTDHRCHDDEVSDIAALSRRSFTCLQSSLRRVRLKFQLDSCNCFGVRLVKFFAQNAMVLEEMCIDSGDRKLCEHMNLDVQRWVGADSTKISLKRKNFADSTWEFSRVYPGSAPELVTSSTSFTIFPLERFFAQNEMVLEEMCIDSGDRKLFEHMNLNVERWWEVVLVPCGLRRPGRLSREKLFVSVCFSPPQREIRLVRADRPRQCW